MRIAADIARGMNYLHSCVPPIVHRDLKSPNLLVDKDFTIKVDLKASTFDSAQRCYIIRCCSAPGEDSPEEIAQASSL